MCVCVSRDTNIGKSYGVGNSNKQQISYLSNSCIEVTKDKTFKIHMPSNGSSILQRRNGDLLDDSEREKY